ncbi:MAG: hypothetical protein EXQ58_08620 [Acidobacteria bacterium]|nr:hypothetical protein [Acidobacteriota bacterium]
MHAVGFVRTLHPAQRAILNTAQSKTREAKLGCVFTQTRVNEPGQPVRDQDSTRCVGAIQTAEEFGPRIYAEAVQRGLLQAQRVIVFWDGSPWFWGITDEHFPDALQIVDLHPAREHLANLAKIVYGPTYSEGKPWLATRYQELDAGKVEALVGVGLSQCSSDAGELEPAVERVEANLKRPVEKMVVDAGFTNQATIEAMAERETGLIGSLPDPDARVERSLKSCGVAEEFYPKAFVYDASQNRYTCPAGKTLRYQDREKQKSSIPYRYQVAKADCQACPLMKAQCCPYTSKRRALWRVEDSEAMTAFKQKMAMPEAQQTYKQRAGVAEFPNAWIKAKIGLRQFRMRGLVKAGMEALWACLTYNIQQWIRLRRRPQRQAAALVAA